MNEFPAKAIHAAKSAHKAWDKFWFRASDPTVLGLMRWLAGGMILYTHIVWGINLEAFFGSAGWNSPDTLAVIQEGQIVPSFWWYVSDSWLYTVHYTCIAVLFLFWIGCATRVTSVMAFMITVSYCYRAHMANFGLDQINTILCLYLCIGPSGATLSMDRLFSVWWKKRKALAAGLPIVMPPVARSTTANLAVRLIQLHFCVIYTYAGLSKLQGPAWWSGEAIWLAFANLEYQSMDMTWIASYPWIADIMTHTTIVWEVSFVALVWVRPIRPYVLAIGFLLHFGIGAAMGMWTFGLIMIFGHVAFWPKQSVRWVTSLVPSAEGLLKVEPTAPNVAATAGAIVGGISDSLRPGLLYVDRTIRRRVESLNYFLQRGFRCLATDDAEAHAVCDSAALDAVVVLGTDMKDAEIEDFHDRHHSRSNPEPLFMVLTEDQSQRLNGNIATPNSYVLAGKVSLGLLRRRILAALEAGDGLRDDSDSPIATQTA